MRRTHSAHWAIAALAAAVLGGCAPEARTATFRIEFADGESAARARVVVARIATGSCPDGQEPLFQATIGMGEEGPAPPALPPGEYCFAADALDDDCRIIASDSISYAFAGATDVTVELDLLSGDFGALCDACACDGAGRCGEPQPGGCGEPPPLPVARFPWNGFTTGGAWTPGAAPLRPTFHWDGSPGATDYHLQLDDSCAISGFETCAFESPEVDVRVAAGTFTPDADLPAETTAPVGRRYFWRVAACNVAGCSEFTPVRWLDVNRKPDDFDGDGYSDVLVGAPLQDNPESEEGVVYVYRGGPGGPAAAASQVLDNPEDDPAGVFGIALDSVGDLNGDGFADAAIGAWRRDSEVENAGAVYVYLGSDAGLGEIADLIVPNPRDVEGGQLGISVAAAGDVDGDGFRDVIAGTTGAQEEVFVLYGSTSGIALDRSQAISPPEEAVGKFFGGHKQLAGGGDVDGDGYADVVIGAKHVDTANTGAGAAYLFNGSASGLRPTPSRALYDPAADNYARFGQGMALDADANGDGYADLAVGAYQHVSQGQVWIYPGSSRGLWDEWAWKMRAPSDQRVPKFGWAVAWGDADADGRPDLLVSAEGWDGCGGTCSEAGRAYVIRGGGEWLEDAPAAFLEPPSPMAGDHFGHAVAFAADVDGDGAADAVIGARHETNTLMRQGGAYLYWDALGRGERPPPSLVLESVAEEGAQFGAAVAQSVRPPAMCLPS